MGTRYLYFDSFLIAFVFKGDLWRQWIERLVWRGWFGEGGYYGFRGCNLNCVSKE